MNNVFELEVPINKYILHYPDLDTAEIYFKFRPFFENVKEGSVGVEVGVLECNNAVHIFKYAKPKKLYLVDRFEKYHDVIGDLSVFNQEMWEDIYKTDIERMAPYNAEFIRKSSMEAVKQFNDESLDFVYLDDDHRKEYVVANVNAWYPKIKKGGIIGGHDWTESEVKSGVLDWVTLNNYNLAYGFSDWWVIK